MSELIKKNGITIGEISVKKNYAKNKTAILFKVYHQGIVGSEEDHFVFYEDKNKDDWFVCLPESLVSLNHFTNKRLVIDVYSKLRADANVNIQEFTDLLMEHHFHVFEESHKQAKRRNRFSFKTMVEKIYNCKR